MSFALLNVKCLPKPAQHKWLEERRLCVWFIHSGWSLLHLCVSEPVYVLSKIFPVALCYTVLPHRPVRSVKSDELGNEKQVCVKCGDHSFISRSLSLSLDLSERVMLSCRTSNKNTGGGRMIRGNEQQIDQLFNLVSTDHKLSTAKTTNK